MTSTGRRCASNEAGDVIARAIALLHQERALPADDHVPRIRSIRGALPDFRAAAVEFDRGSGLNALGRTFQGNGCYSLR